MGDMRKKLIIVIFVLVAINAVAIGLLIRESSAENDSCAVSEDIKDNNREVQEETEADEEKEKPAVQDPLIAVVDYDTSDAERIINIVIKAGGQAERVGVIDDLDVDKYDAIIIPGGNSVTPSMYGAEKQPETKNTDIEKDKFQFSAVQQYVEAGKPVLGICRGEQLVNNVMGGTTIQHMQDGWHKYNRMVNIAEGSWLYDTLGPEAETYHFHHQCVENLGDGLYATAWDAQSGCIEAYEHETLPIYGLQWHPEGIEESGVEVFKCYLDVVTENMMQNATE